MASTSETSPKCQVCPIKVAGAWVGNLQVPLDRWTVKDLKESLARASGNEACYLKLICGGKVLKEESPGCLRQEGVTERSKLLVTRTGGSQVEKVRSEAAIAKVEEERTKRLARLRAAADAMAKRSGNDAFSSRGYNFTLENQAGERVVLSENDQRALVMGLALHGKAGKLIKTGKYTDALDVLELAEEAFDLCNPAYLQGVDNAALLQLDYVWCLFQLQDIARLTVARERLIKAREGLRKSHGPNLERMRMLQGGFRPELAVYVRLELLEGVAAFHSQQSPQTARASLLSAQDKFRQLAVSDEALAQLAAMGFSTKESRRALRMSGQNVEAAVAFVLEQRQLKERKAAEERQRREARREQKRYGRTATRKGVDISKLDQLASLGYDRWLAAEALRQAENSSEAALACLLNEEARAALQVAISVRASRKRGRGELDPGKLAELEAMGFSREQASAALKATDNGYTAAVDRLLNNVGTSGPSGNASGGESERQVTQDEPPGVQEAAGSSHSEETSEEEVDEEMEADLAANISGDPLAQYDVDVKSEGEAIMDYLSRLEVPTEGQAAS